MSDPRIFDTFREARDTAGEEIAGHPAWYVIPRSGGFVIRYRPGGPLYPELQVVQCDLCYAPVEGKEAPALCDKCDRTGRAHAKLERNRREWEADGSP